MSNFRKSICSKHQHIFIYILSWLVQNINTYLYILSCRHMSPLPGLSTIWVISIAMTLLATYVRHHRHFDLSHVTKSDELAMTKNKLWNFVGKNIECIQMQTSNINPIQMQMHKCMFLQASSISLSRMSNHRLFCDWLDQYKRPCLPKN